MRATSPGVPFLKVRKTKGDPGHSGYRTKVIYPSNCRWWASCPTCPDKYAFDPTICHILREEAEERRNINDRGNQGNRG